MKHILITSLCALSMLAMAAPPPVVPSTQTITVNINGSIAWPEDNLAIQTFDSDDRATTAPHLAHQVGWQMDDKSLWIASGTNAGDWLPFSLSWSAINDTPTTLGGYGITDAAGSGITISAGAGLTGGGDLSANRSIALDPGSIASLSLADTALQPSVLIDEDDMVSDSNTHVPTQQSVKAYVDANAGGSAQIDVQEFTSDGTWTKPAGAFKVTVYLVGGGGGGASGGNSDSSPASGGGAGTGAGYLYLNFPAEAFGDTEDVIIGAGGTGGAPTVFPATTPNAGGAGIESYFGDWYAVGGNGAPSATAGNSTGNASFSYLWPSGALPTQAGGAGQAGNGSAGSSISLFGQSLNPGGGGGGGGGATGSGGAGGNYYTFAITLPQAMLGGGGAGGSGAGGNGGNGRVSYYEHGGGRGGGGGASGRTTNNGGNGGNGVRGGGGGGGGGALSPHSSGSGGNGGDGYALIITYCAPTP